MPGKKQTAGKKRPAKKPPAAKQPAKKKTAVKKAAHQQAEPRLARLERRNRELECECERLEAYCGLVQDISTFAGKSFKLESFLDRIMQRVMKATAADSGTMFLLEHDEASLRFAVVKGPGAERLRGKTLPAGEGIAGRVAATGKHYLSSDVKKDKLWSPRVARELGYKTKNILAVPLKAGGRVRGVIEVINKEGSRRFNQEDLSLLAAMAAEAAVALENARLLIEAGRRADQFVTLSRLSAILNSTLDAKRVRKSAMEAAVELLQCETGSLYLIDEEKNELYFEVALGEKGEAVKEIRLKMGEGIAGWVAEQGRSDLVPDTGQDPRWASRVDKKSKFQTRNMVTVPVRARGRLIGVLQALNKLGGRKFDEEDLRLMESLADQVAIALENARLYHEQKVMFMETAQALATAIEKRDPYTGGHTRRVRDLCMATAREMRLSAEEMEWIELAAILHDAGKIGVDDQILRKPGRLTDDEFAQMKQHPVYGFEILQHVTQLGRAVPGMKHHHERFDGKGYPDGIENGKIPFIARLIAVADTWDAMTSDRPYRKGLPDEVAVKELRRCSGTQFDPRVVRAFLRAYKKGAIGRK